ncbi:MAG: Hpt domain-containing protein [Clostridia bacterium]
MNETIEKLKEYGADIDSAISRFVGDTELYQLCCMNFLDDLNFIKLNEAVLNADYKKIFECAHTIKGVAGNLSLTPIYNASCKLVEALRKEDYSNLKNLYAEVDFQFNRLKEILSNCS